MENTPNQAPATHWVNTYVTWLRSHEVLILIVAGAFLLFHFYDRGVSAWEAHDQRLSSQAAQQVQVDHTANQQVQAELTQLLSTVSQQQQALDKLISQRATQTVEQKKKDAQMTPNELATRFQGLLKVGPADVTSLEPTGNLVFTSVAAVANISQLEDFQACRLDVVDLKTELAGEQSLVVKQTDALSGVQKELIDEKTSHAADIKFEKAKSHHAALKWFKIGVVVGAIGTEAIRILVGRP